MAKVKISKSEIEKMLKDQLGCEDIKWDKNGAATVDLDFDEIKKVEKEEHHHYHSYPIYIKPLKIKPNTPYWYVNTTSGSSTGNLTYNLK